MLASLRTVRFTRHFTSVAKALNAKAPKPLELKMRIEPIPRPNEPLETKRARLVYQSRKRGILETDLLLSQFAKLYLPSMSMEEMVEFDQLMDEADWDIYYWATKNYTVNPMPQKWQESALMMKLQVMSENKEKRLLRMPELHDIKN
ncbi:hypothetical protein BABINDRAFT_10451 [Babjeviella inositovora NRRL Y-12698]|uniref:Succinate dehydrogenase assembly factor 2, mitochondrial n=1 Tax=Babjeviella inositovora NRRL Y-12698 TaxID=984486 RepID=A0A1E3QHK7_9ASCO|nr:uncharacterized protein BABINDRAFT_10451 [Babjeviella inositovora NRRL Y-12698]ODQ77088.1 hypothetical protein BABINDRAFT_10451 [Babjeviella inositovora NRRL Y-12698]